MSGIRPIHYKIHLEPDFSKFQFTGKLELRLEVPAPASEVSLNILDLAIWKCTLMSEGQGETCGFSVDPRKKGPVIGYMVVITVMVCAASSLLGAADFSLSGRVMAFAGAVAFYLSDVFVARDRFMKNEFVNRLVGLPMYYAGQFLIAFSLGFLRVN